MVKHLTRQQKRKGYSLLEINTKGLFSALPESDECQIGASKNHYHCLEQKSRVRSRLSIRIETLQLYNWGSYLLIRRLECCRQPSGATVSVQECMLFLRGGYETGV